MTTEGTSSSGADLARIALRQARENARRNGAKVAKPKRTTRRSRGDGRDPLPLAGVMQQLLVDNGWQNEAEGGNLIHRWPAIVGEERAAHWRAVKYDEPTRTLTVVCESDSWAKMLSLVSRQLVADVNQAMKPGTLATIKVRKAGYQASVPPEPAVEADPVTQTRTLPPSAPLPSEYAEIRARLREAKAQRDAERERPAPIAPRRLQASPDDHAEARYLEEALREQAARAADVEARALRKAREERAASRSTTPSTPRRTSSVA